MVCHATMEQSVHQLSRSIGPGLTVNSGAAQEPPEKQTSRNRHLVLEFRSGNSCGAIAARH